MTPAQKLPSRPALLTRLILLLACYGTTAQGAPGVLDTSFGTGGFTTIAGDANPSTVDSLRVQSDGRIVWMSVRDSSIRGAAKIIIGRHNSDGTSDTAFGVGGQIVIGLYQAVSSFGLELQPDGKIIAVVPSNSSSESPIEVQRYTSTGILDASFGSGGRVTTAFIRLSPVAVAVDGSGRILVAGGTLTSNLELQRRNVDGSFDNTFGSNGKLTMPNETALGSVRFMRPKKILVQKDKSVLILGTASINGSSLGNYLALARFHSTGAPDTEFGVAGISLFNAGPLATDSTDSQGGGQRFNEMARLWSQVPPRLELLLPVVTRAVV